MRSQVRVREDRAAGAGAGARLAFRVVMAYDDFASGKRAMATCNFLVYRLGGGIELRSSMWKFDVLRSAKLNQMAVDDAIEADVIIVANSRNGGLPDEVKKWVENWVPRKPARDSVLVALLDFTGEDVQASAQARTFLKEAAASAKIDFLPQEIRFRNSRMPLVPSKLFNRRQGTAPNQPGRKTPPLEGWGIND